MAIGLQREFGACLVHRQLFRKDVVFNQKLAVFESYLKYFVSSILEPHILV